MTPPFDPNTPAPPQQPGVWPPPPGVASPYEQTENTSGMKGAVPPQLAALKWNWGAFLLSFLWTVNHRMTWGWGILVLSLLGRIPGIGLLFSIAVLGVSIYLGLNGHKLGWQNRRFEGGVAQYFEVQNAWMKWGIGVTVVSFIFGVLGGIATFMGAAHNGGAAPGAPFGR